MQLHPLLVVGRHLIDEPLGLLMGFLLVNDEFPHILAEVVADGAQNKAVFRIEQPRRGLRLLGCLDRPPQAQQVVQIPLQFLRAAAHPGGADDHAHAGGNVQLRQGLPQFVAVLLGDLPGHAAGARVRGHQHHVAAGQADEAGEGGALGAALLLLHLHDQFLPLVEQLLDVLATAFMGFAEALRGDVPQGQEAAPLGAEVHERGLQAGLHPNDLALVDVALGLLAAAVFEVQVIELLAIDQSHPQLFGLGGVD